MQGTKCNNVGGVCGVCKALSVTMLVMAVVCKH